MKRLFLAAVLLCWVAPAAWAKVDLVTLPSRDKTQVTIYNAADLTLVRESRTLTLKKGVNRLQFSWAGTLIDPTSLDLMILGDAAKNHVEELVYPPRSQAVGVWRVTSETGGPVPVQITYFTSGLSWRAFYLGTLAPDEKTMVLTGFVRVDNHSGEDYANAQTRLVVGQVQVLDEIAMLARRPQPYGRPGLLPPPAPPILLEGDTSKARYEMPAAVAMLDAASMQPKEIVKEALSEYFLYTIEGTENLVDKTAKRLPSFEADQVPVTNLYKFEEDKYSTQVVRFLSFKNDAAHDLGQTPIPGGSIQVFRKVDDQARLTYEGRSEFKYIPVGQEVELNLGSVADVTVEPTLMNQKTDRYMFDTDGDISGYDDIHDYKVVVKNTRNVAVRVEVRRNFPVAQWELVHKGDAGTYEKVDQDTVQFTLDLPPRSQKTFQYTLTLHQGQRAE